MDAFFVGAENHEREGARFNLQWLFATDAFSP